MARPTTTNAENVLSVPKPVRATRVRRKSTNPTNAAAVAIRAFALYCERGCQHGHDVEDWLQAERELQERAKSSAARQPTMAAPAAAWRTIVERTDASA
jgi:hypothetical protein